MFPLKAIRQCIKEAPAAAALGADQWRPHDWALLPEDGLIELQALLAGIEREVRSPEQVLHNVAVFIDKPTTPPSERSITLTSGLYRLWCKLRRPRVSQWEVETAGFWDKAVAGSSALQTALSQNPAVWFSQFCT